MDISCIFHASFSTTPPFSLTTPFLVPYIFLPYFLSRSLFLLHYFSLAQNFNFPNENVEKGHFSLPGYRCISLRATGLRSFFCLLPISCLAFLDSRFWDFRFLFVCILYISLYIYIYIRKHQQSRNYTVCNIYWPIFRIDHYWGQNLVSPNQVDPSIYPYFAIHIP